MANWRTIVPSHEPAHRVKGTELEVLIPDGFRSQFAIYSVRCYKLDGKTGERYADMYYRIRDAGRVTDARVRSGIRPPIIAACDTLDEAMNYIEAYRVTD